ncbi:copper resistance CopC family protein [Mycolicibacterium sarraceniae]|uniref:Copper resistance protein C n=1 Tax=Mycolicibacterium sarraceniae TaxID=1534348 RepID=A0A7I7SNF1_9MYCO|nr:copper resistance CopC family protein [Mycolicibacterium sarraceniae]BBY58273.1 copper resistance protein C [Mycolicibacterium sarraceniae]
MVLRRAVAIVLLIAGMAAAGTAVAAAHAVRVAADPAPGAALAVAPSRVSATFNEVLHADFAAMTVVGPDGNLWSDPTPQVQGAVVSVGLHALGPAGSYTVNYRVTSADGHVVSGSWSFALTVAGNGAPGPPAAVSASAPEKALPIWPFIVGAAAVIGCGVMWSWRRRS